MYYLVQMNPAQASRLRQQIARLRLQREALERRLLRRRRMLGATLVERYLGTGDAKRATPAYYLAFPSGDKQIQRYVRQDDLSKIMPRARAWSEYYHLIAQWVKLNQELAQTWRALGRAQTETPNRESE
jgi:hypothetical protein